MNLILEAGGERIREMEVDDSAFEVQTVVLGMWCDTCKRMEVANFVHVGTHDDGERFCLREITHA